jgi:hypothetical protein
VRSDIPVFWFYENVLLWRDYNHLPDQLHVDGTRRYFWRSNWGPMPMKKAVSRWDRWL